MTLAGRNLVQDKVRLGLSVTAQRPRRRRGEGQISETANITYPGGVK